MRRRLAMVALGVVAALLAVAVGANAWLSDVVYNDLPGPPLPTMDPIAGGLDSATCGACHTRIYEAWRPSAHGRAHLDPLYLADFRNQGEPYVCEYCHTPLVEQRAQVVTGLWMAWPVMVPRAAANPRYDEALRPEGIGCVACHQRDGAMQGPFDAQGTPPHPTRNEPLTVEVCRTCHHLDLTVGSELPRPIQDTFGEWDAYRAEGGDKDCIECHMPRTPPEPVAIDGPPRLGRDHRLKGPRDVAFLRTGAVVRAVELDPTTGRGAVIVYNGTGHRLPTAEPQRRLAVTLEALSGRGVVLASVTHDIQRVILLPRLVEASDTSLRPREERRVELEVPMRGARSMRVRVVFHLWDPDDHVARLARIRPSDLEVEVYSESAQAP